MPTPNVYGQLSEEHEHLRALAFLFLMSEEVDSIEGPFASDLFDIVGDQTVSQAREIVQSRAEPPQ